jgi:hypothetical protein
MADGDTVFNERRVRGSTIPLDARNLGGQQKARQECDVSELAESMFDAMYKEVDSWPELTDDYAEFQRFKKWKAAQQRRNV